MAKKYKLSESERKSRRKYERKRREKIRDAGLREVRIVCHPDDANMIKRLARRLEEERSEGENA